MKCRSSYGHNGDFFNEETRRLVEQMPTNNSHRWLHVLEQHRRYSSDFPCHLTITNNRMRSHIVGLSNECARCGIISNPQAQSISHRQLYVPPRAARKFIYIHVGSGRIICNDFLDNIALSNLLPPGHNSPSNLAPLSN